MCISHGCQIRPTLKQFLILNPATEGATKQWTTVIIDIADITNIPLWRLLYTNGPSSSHHRYVTAPSVAGFRIKYLFQGKPDLASVTDADLIQRWLYLILIFSCLAQTPYKYGPRRGNATSPALTLEMGLTALGSSALPLLLFAVSAHSVDLA